MLSGHYLRLETDEIIAEEQRPLPLRKLIFTRLGPIAAPPPGRVPRGTLPGHEPTAKVRLGRAKQHKATHYELGPANEASSLRLDQPIQSRASPHKLSRGMDSSC